MKSLYSCSAWVSAAVPPSLYQLSATPSLALSALVLTVSVRRRARSGAHQRAVLFRIVEAIGRWSMLDVFVVTLMVGLVRFQTLAAIHAGSGAAAFGAVVILTMLASYSFDPRLIWDNDKDDHD